VNQNTNRYTADNYRRVVEENQIIGGVNRNFQIKYDRLSKITIHKNALTGTNTKAVVLTNQSCAPFVFGVKDYVIV
jgi:hypothetical protein